MNKRWLAQLNKHQLYCYHCGILILKQQDLVADHFPIARSKGGKQVVPSHRWCDIAHGARNRLTSQDLKHIINKWEENGKPINPQAIQSLIALKKQGR